VHNVGSWPAESGALGWGWDGVLRRPKRCFVKEGFKLVAKAGYGRTVLNVQGKISYQQTWQMGST